MAATTALNYNRTDHNHSVSPNLLMILLLVTAHLTGWSWWLAGATFYTSLSILPKIATEWQKRVL